MSQLAIAPLRKTDTILIDPVQEQRIRAAWLYYVEGHNQKATAEILGVPRLQVTRLLADARRRGEVNIKINSDLQNIVHIQRQLETKFGLGRAIIAPRTDPNSDPVHSIAVAAGQYISENVNSDTSIGVGWGRTLYSSLPHIEGRELKNVRVISLLGGISEAKRYNPSEFAWQFAERFNGEGYLVSAPAIVDSAETKQALMERCGIDQIFDQANNLDMAFISTGGILSLNTSYRVGHLSEADRKSLIDKNVVGDILYNFINIHGEIVDHPINKRVVSVKIDNLKKANNIVLISGGPEKIEALIGSLKLLKPSCFITDEITAASILDHDE